MPLLFFAIRFVLEALTSDRAPYALNFVAVVLATVAAGWRSGLLALAVGQLLTWYAVIEPQWTLAMRDPSTLWGLIIATGSQALLLVIVALYQLEVGKGANERERRLELQDHARREIHHRIRNNFQTVLALIHLQARRSEDSASRDALTQVAERIKAVAAVTERLAIPGEDLAVVSIRDHLCDLCRELEQALADGVEVHCDIAEVKAGAVEATYLGLIVNELVTNALKHAFAGGRSGWVRVKGEVDGRAFHLVIRDNGSGMKPRSEGSGSGLGQTLVESFVRELDGRHELSSSESGTTHRIVVPELVRSAA